MLEKGGTSTDGQALTVEETGGAIVDWSASSTVPWLTATKSDSTLQVKLTAEASALAVGNYDGTVAMASPNAAETVLSIPIRLSIVMTPVPPAIGLSPTAASFKAKQGGANPPDLTIQVSNAGGGTLTWKATTDVPWLTVKPSAKSFSVRANVAGLSGRSYQGKVTVSAVGAPPRTVNIALAVTPAGWVAVDAPENGGLFGVWGSGPHDVWAVGRYGIIHHWNGAAWQRVKSGTTQNLWGIWGSGPKDFWAYGNARTLLRWNGSQWSPVSTPITASSVQYGKVWGTGPNDVWVTYADEAILDSCGILRWNGSTWQNYPTGSTCIVGMWAAAANDIWAAATYHPGGNQLRGAVVRWNGTSWNPFPSAETNYLSAIIGTSPNDIWVAGATLTGAGLIQRWNGSSWTNSPLLAAVYQFWGTGGTGPKSLWIVGGPGLLYWDGATWNPALNDKDTNAMWGASGSEIWAVGSGLTATGDISKIYWGP